MRLTMEAISIWLRWWFADVRCLDRYDDNPLAPAGMDAETKRSQLVVIRFDLRRLDQQPLPTANKCLNGDVVNIRIGKKYTGQKTYYYNPDFGGVLKA